MEYSEFRRHLGKAGLSIGEFAALIHVLPNSVSNYSKKRAVPVVYAIAAVLLGDAADRQIPFRHVLSRYGIRPRSASGGKVTRLDDYRQHEEPIHSGNSGKRKDPKAE